MPEVRFCLVMLAPGIAQAATEDVCLPAEDPSRVVVAGGSIAEMLYALQAGELIVAVDSTANYLPETKDLPSVGYVRNLSAEGILALKPSLILGEHDMGPAEVLNQISSVEVEVKRIEEAAFHSRHYRQVYMHRESVGPKRIRRGKS